MTQTPQEMFDNALQHHRAGRLDDAERLYQEVVALDPGHTNSLHCLGLIASKKGRHEAAADLIGQAISHADNIPVFHYNLGRVLGEQDKAGEAAACYERAIALNPNFAEACNNLGALLIELDRLGEAVKYCERAVTINPNFAEAWNNLGGALRKQDRLDESAACFRRVLAIRPDLPDVHCSLANILVVQGSFNDALSHYADAIAARPDYVEAHYARAGIKTFRQGDPDLAALEALAEKRGLTENQALCVHFALGKALEDCGEYDRAFEHFKKGNGLKHRQIRYDEKEAFRDFLCITEAFDSTIFKRRRGAGDPSPAPIFIVGMPRSGTTLVEQILSSHPLVHGAGELVDFDKATGSVMGAGSRPGKYRQSIPALDTHTLRRLGENYLARLPVPPKGKLRITDKLPFNFFNIGLIHLALPNARIIHVKREPTDTCVSCFTNLFKSGNEFSYDLAELGRFYRYYRALMTHWRSVLPPGAMIEVTYEDVVDNIEEQARRLLDYCGLPWDERCLDFHKSGRPVNTASAAQVRQPLFRSSLQRWRRYESGLVPLLQELVRR